MKSKVLSLSNLTILLAIPVVWWITAFKIEPFLHYYNQQIGFFTTLDFFKNYLAYPGGMSAYIADFVSQFFSFNLFGSFIIVLVAAIQGLIVLDIVKRLTRNTKLNFSFFVVVLVLAVIVLCDYRYPYYASIRLLLAFLFSWIFCIINSKFPKQSVFVWPLIAVLLFYLASGASLIVFSISTVLILIHTRKKNTWLIAVPLFLLFAGAVPYIGYKFVFPLNLMNLYRITEVKPPQMLAYDTSYTLIAYYFILPVILSVAYLLKLVPENKSTTNTLKGKVVVNKIRFYKKTPFIVSIQVIVCVAIGWFLFIKSFDSFKKKLIYIEYYAETNQWRKVVKQANEIKVYDFRVNYQLNRAYSHLGQLPQNLFNYPQLLGSNGLFFDTSSMNGSFTMPMSDLYFDLGFMSESLHWAFEAQTLLPNSPRILKRLVMIYLVNGKYEIAEKFLKVLGNNMLYKDWVDKYTKYIADTTLVAKDKVIIEKRQYSPQKRAINSHPVENLKLLIETNKGNRMAYDYLLTHCILDSNYPDFIDYVQNYRYYNIKTLPNSWAEMLSMHILKIKSMPPFVDDETLPKDCLKRFTEFNRTMKQFRGDSKAAQNTLHRNFENSYWYYMLYLSPNVTGVLNNKTQIK